VHELRTPLTALNTAVQLLLRPDLTDLKRGQIAEMVRDEVSRLTDLTTQYLDYARLESGRAQFRHTTFDLGKLFQDCLEIMHPRADEKGIKIDLELPEMLPPLTADEDKIKQVVLNLISNAIKYNEPKGRIKISAQAKPIEMVFSVSDTGQGIPPESVPHLFEKFYRVPKQETISSGTGLGLTICKRIIEAHNGTIDVQSTVGKGTIFTIHLPLVQ
jgi:two-component system phosphate regulon sensor histidine kinase PhoR